MQTVDLYLGLGSRYSYLAWTQLARIEEATGCRFVLHPISSIELMALRGVSPFEGAPVSGQYAWNYRQRDAERWAAHYGVPFREPAPLPADHRLMAKACHAARRQDRLRDYVVLMFQAVFIEHTRIDQAACIALACRLDLRAAQFASDLASDAVEACVTAAAREALSRGAFGVPSFFVGEEMFWGNDRLPLLEHRLASTKRGVGGDTQKRAAVTSHINERNREEIA